MSLYQTTQGFGVDYRDEFGRRHRKFVGALEAAQAVHRQATEWRTRRRPWLLIKNTVIVAWPGFGLSVPS